MAGDIRITGIDRGQTQRNAVKDGLYDAKFTLSAEPPIDWAHYFNEARKSRKHHANYRDARVAGDMIVITCALEEMASQLEDLKSDVMRANDRYRTSTAAAAEQAKLITERDRKDEARKNEALDKLRFDLR